MSRDEERAKCIKAMKAVRKQFAGKCLDFTSHAFDALMTASFDSLHGLANVNPVEPTDEMNKAGFKFDYVADVFRAMSAARRLTNPPEKKP